MGIKEYFTEEAMKISKKSLQSRTKTITTNIKRMKILYKHSERLLKIVIKKLNDKIHKLVKSQS